MGSERRMRFETERVVAVQGHPSTLILAPIECAYAISCWSSIVSCSYLAPFQRYGTFSAENSTLPLFHRNFGGVPLELDCHCWVYRSEDHKQIIRVITLELTEHICIRPRYISVTDRQRDGRLTVTIPPNALSASRGKSHWRYHHQAWQVGNT